ncbi:MAG TPA: DUF2935 domain-containing protein, partial [Bacillales bacterium]|nr:DUF2935 domain-containing protein [Bacillales bacterium]
MKGENRWLETAQFEHAFWLQILGDHARFIYFAFPANERAYWQQAERFAERFDEQLQRAKSIGNDERRMLELTRSAQELAQSFRQFKLVLIRRQLVGTLRFHLSPAFVNHMLNELEEYLRLLNDLVKQQVPPPTHAVHHHLLWLLDATGHAGTIEKELEMTEYNLRSKSRQFTKDFEHFYLKAVEMAGFLRANLQR